MGLGGGGEFPDLAGLADVQLGEQVAGELGELTGRRIMQTGARFPLGFRVQSACTGRRTWSTGAVTKRPGHVMIENLSCKHYASAGA